MFRHGSKVPMVPITAALAIFTGCAREALAPEGKAAEPAVSPQALAADLDLPPSEEGRIRALLDNLHTEMMLAAEAGPDALVTAARSAHAQLEAALPPDARTAFHEHLRHRDMGARPGGQLHAGAEDHPPHGTMHAGDAAGHHGMYHRKPEERHARGTRGGG